MVKATGTLVEKVFKFGLFDESLLYATLYALEKKPFMVTAHQMEIFVPLIRL